MYNCSHKDLTTISQLVPLPDLTEWVEVSGNHIKTIEKQEPALENVTRISLRDSHMTIISAKFLQTFLHTKQLQTLILSANNITILPEIIRKLDFLSEIQIGRNPFTCNCKMKWMTEWINGLTTTYGERVVKDYEEVTCWSREKKGKPIYLLNEQDYTDMGCIKGTLTILQEILLGAFAAILIFIVVAIIIIGRRWEEVRWLLYLHLDILDKSDRDEDLTNMEYDALLSYWYVKCLTFNNSLGHDAG